MLRLLLVLLFALSASAQRPELASGVTDPAEPAEISTTELQRLLDAGSARLFDDRPPLEFAISHIPGAENVAQKPGSSMALYVSDAAEIGRRVGSRKDAAIVLYCNGPFCGKSKRVAQDLAKAGFSNVRRYQAGMPVWRALGGVTQMDAAGAEYVLAGDRTAIWLDTRSAAQFAAGTVPGAKRIGMEITQGGKDNPAMRKAKDDGTLPMNDHNTRVIVFGDEPRQARAVAEALAREAFHNVSFFSGTYADLAKLLE